MEFFLGLLALCYLALPIAGFVLALAARKRIREMKDETNALKTQLDVVETQLQRRMKSFEERLSGFESAGLGAQASPPHHEPLPVQPAPERYSEPFPFGPPVRIIEPEPSPAPPLHSVLAVPPKPSPVPAPPPPFVFAPPLPIPQESHPFPEAESGPPPPPPLPPPVPSSPARRPPVELHPPAPAKPPFDWENLIGVKAFSWIAGIALVIGAVSFLRYSYDWFTPTQKTIAGIIVGITLLLVCERKAARKYPVTANAMDGAAIAVLFSTFMAAHALWKILPGSAAFVLLALVAATGVLLSIRRDSIFIALLGLLGGFSTPILLSTGEDRPIALFSYLALLNAGLGWVAHKKRWPLLTIVSVVFTACYQWGWVAKYLDEGKLPLALGIFFVFPVLTFGAMFFGENEETARDGSFKAFGLAARFASAIPLFFALYLAAVPAYGARYGLLFGFLVILVLGLAAVAIWLEEGGLHLAGAASALLVSGIWIFISYNTEAWPVLLGFVVFFVLFFLGTPLFAEKMGRPLTGMGIPAVIAAPAFLFVFPALAWKESATREPFLLVAVLLLLLGCIAAYAVNRSEPGLYMLGSAFAVSAIATWSFQHLTPEMRIPGFWCYGAASFFFIGASLYGIEKASEGAQVWRRLLFLGLAAHPFLIWVAGSHTLGLPPAPWLVLLFAVVGASLYAAFRTRSGPFWVTMVSASQFVLIVYGGGSPADATTGILATIAIAALGIITVPDLFAPLTELKGKERSFVAAGLTGLILAQFVIAIEASPSVPPSFGLILGGLALVTGVLLWVSSSTGWHGASIIGVLPAYLTVLTFHEGGAKEVWNERLILASVLFLLFFGYSWLIAKQAGASPKPYLSTILAAGCLFLTGRQSLIDGGYSGIVGLLPVLEAVAMALLLWRLFQVNPPEKRAMGQLALVAGAALAFITVAIPVQLDKEWITIGWALEAAALAWLFTKVPHRGLLFTSSALFMAVFIRLTLNPEVLGYHERTGTPIFNWYLYTYLLPALAMFAATWFFHKTEDRLAEGFLRASSFVPALGTILLFCLVNIEIADFFSEGQTLTFNFTRGVSFGQDVAYTLAWAIFAIGILTAGVFFNNKPTRITSIGLLIITILKAFLRDLPRLGGLYQALSFFGLAVSLALVALAFQKFVLSKKTESK